jgi:hypothetical protein
MIYGGGCGVVCGSLLVCSSRLSQQVYMHLLCFFEVSSCSLINSAGAKIEGPISVCFTATVFVNRI